MPPKKKETPLYQEVNSQKDWESLLEQKGLFVVDVYQEWSGPCNALSGHFRRIMIELSDKLLQFAIAKVDNTEALKDYRGKCEPCFLFYAEGMLVAFVHGANVPLIINTIKKQLDFEHKVLEGLEVRKEVQDVFIIAKYRKERQATRASKIEIRILQTEETAPQSFTVAIIKPNVVENRKVNDIFMELKEHNIHIMVEEERLLTEEEAKIFYDCKKDEAFFEDLIKFMTSGPCHVLVLTKEQIFDEVIYDWQHLMGPPNVEEAKDKAPNSLRARYGKQGIMNGLHGSENRRAAARELDFFFPTFKVPIIQGKRVQRTLAILRPDVFNEKKDEVLQTIKEAGFQIPLQKVVHLTEKQAEEFYSESNYQPFFGNLTDYMSSNPILALVLARSDAINRWQNLLGPQSLDEAMIAAPESLRAKYAFDGIPFNQLHGSDSEESAKKEICFFFPTETTLAVIKPDAYPHKDAIVERILEAGFFIADIKEATITSDIAEALYEDMKDKDFYKELINFMTSDTSVFMVLVREIAVEGWREEIGPTDPEIARLEAPNSLRAKFGKDILHNGFYGCTTKEEAKRMINEIFCLVEELSDEMKLRTDINIFQVNQTTAKEPADLSERRKSPGIDKIPAIEEKEMDSDGLFVIEEAQKTVLAEESTTEETTENLENIR